MTDEPLSDLGLAVLLLNSVDLLEEPADRMATDLAWWRRALTHYGHPELATAQRDGDLPMLQTLRQTIRTVFECREPEEARGVLNVALLYAEAVVQVTPQGLGVSGDLRGRLLFAVARHVAEHGSPGSASATATRAGARTSTRAGAAPGATAAPSATTARRRAPTARARVRPDRDVSLTTR